MVAQNVEKRTSKIELHVPKFEELCFRQKLYSDLETMNYGDSPFDFSVVQWQAWFDKWVKNPKDRFYAYLIDKETGKPVGDVNYHYDEQLYEFMIGVVILGECRGRGFAQDGLKLLCEKAKTDGIKKLCNLIPKNRESAIYIHKKFGFVQLCDKETESAVFLEKSL